MIRSEAAARRLYWILAVFLAGCVAVPLDRMSDDYICGNFNSPMSDRKSIRAESGRRALLTVEEQRRAERQMVMIGDSRCAAMASWGRPSRVNTTITRYGREEQWVYRDYGYHPGPSSYLYIRDDRVIAIQK